MGCVFQMIPIQRNKKIGVVVTTFLASLFLFIGNADCDTKYTYDKTDHKAEQKKYMAKLSDDERKVALAIKSTRTLIDQSKGRPYLAELYLRLAELYIEKSRIIYFIRKNQVSDNLASLKQLESKNFKIRAIEIYQHILDEFPSFEHRDKALFFMAHEYRELGKMEEMIKNYRAIIKEHTRSQYVPECYLLIGDDFNNKGDLVLAKRHYTAVLNYPQSPAITIARYKLAWCHINEKGFQDAIKLFEKCVMSETTGELDVDTYKRVDIKQEAFIDIAYCYPDSYTDTSPLEAIQYFKKFAWSRSVYTTVLEKLAYRYYIKKRWHHAAFVYRELSELQYDSQKLLEYARNTFECVQELGTFEDADKDMAHIIKALKLQKYSVHISEKEKTKNNTDYELYARNIVTLLHENARKGKSIESFKRAADAYAHYLSFFDDSPVQADMAKNYAETLFSSQQYFEAGRQYEKVARKTVPDKKPNKDLLYSAVISYYRALKEKEDLTYYQTSFTRDGLRTTGTQYASFYPDGDQVPHVLFNIAWIAYDEGDYDRAITEFTEFIHRYPSGETTAAATHLTLNAYHQKEDYKGLVAFGKQVLAHPPTNDKKFRAEIAQIVGASESKIISSLTVAAVNDWDTGRSNLMAFADKNKQTQLGEQALNALLVSGKERYDIETVYTTGSQLIQQYPKSDILESTMGVMIDSFLNISQFRLLAVYLEQYALKYPKNKNSSAFLYQAGQIREMLGHHQHANDDYGRFLNTVSKNGKSQETVIFSMADNALAMNQPDKVISLLTGYRKKLSPTGRIKADAWVADLYLLAGDVKKATTFRKRAYQAYSPKLARKDDAMRSAVARMVFHSVDRTYPAYMGMKLGNRIDNSVVQSKAKLLEKLEKGYHEVIQYQSPQWALAACRRSFDINLEFAKFLETAPLPDLSKEQKKQYQDLIAKKVRSYMDKAQQYKSACVTRAQKWEACDPKLATYLFDDESTGTRLKQSVTFSKSAKTSAIADGFLQNQSLKTLHEKLMRAPEDMQTLLLLAAGYVEVGDFKHAILVTKKILQSAKPEQKQIKAAAYNLLGMAYLYDQNDPGAKNAFKNALAEAPAHIDAKINLAGLYTHYGYDQNARRLYQTLNRIPLEQQNQMVVHPRARELYYENNKLAKK
jgi:TolA-binding protein/Flp pilus assembly protein TadD